MLEQYLHRHPPPVMIFCGPEGVGRWSAAEAYIQQSLCETGNGCGVCAACRKINRGEHPDLIRFPEDRVLIGESDDPEPFTIRWLLRTRVCYTPFDGKLRFVLFPRADLIQHEAETALLKTLEEPPEHTRFLLLVRNLSEIKPTIVSRGVVIPFQLLPAPVLESLTADLGAADRELLGGSLALAGFLRSALAAKMRDLLRQGLQHPKALGDLERWLLQGERKNFADQGYDEELNYLELLDGFTGMMLQEIQSLPERPALARAILAFKGDLHRDLSGLHPYLTGRLFQRLDWILFRKSKAPGSRLVHVDQHGL